MAPELDFDDVPSGIIVMEDGGGIVSANLAMEELLGCDRAWLLGKPFSVVLTRPAAILYHASIYMEVRNRGRVQETYLDLKSRSGDAVPVLCSASLRRKGERTLIVMSATRMSERRRMEEDLLRTRRITEQIPGAVYQYLMKADGSQSVPYASEAVRTLFGVSPGAIQQSSAELLASLHPADIDEFRASIRQSASSLQLWRQQFRARPHASAPYRWLEGHALPDRLPDGATVWHGFVQDVTERRAVEDALRDKLASDRANKAKSEFLARVSHELRTPLNAILGFSRILMLDREHPFVPRQQQRLQHIHDAGQDLLLLIDEVLDITGIEAGAVRLRPEWLAVEPLVTSVARLVDEPARRRAVLLRVQVAPGAQVHADAARLRQVLTNLLSNAVKYTVAGGTVTASCAVEGARLVIEVHDTGPGMTADQLAHLFEPFNRLGAERTDVQGTGLGLVIVKRLVEAMDGTLGVRSTAVDGTTFRVELPCAPHAQAAASSVPVPAPAPLQAAPGAAPAGSAAAGTGQPLRILYVEDNPINAVVMESICEMQAGLVLHIEESGAAALAWLRHHPVDLLLIDMSLPDMDGLTLFAQIRALPVNGAVDAIAVSAEAMPDVLDQARRAGMHDYWVKPIEVDATLAKLRRRLALAQGVLA